MEFTIPLQIDTCRQGLLGRESHIPVLADTRVHIEPLDGHRSHFSVRRVWKGKMGIRYCVMEANGILTTDSIGQTKVLIQIQINGLGYIILAAMVIAFIVGFSNPRYGGYGIVIGLVLTGLLLLDWKNLREVIHALES